MKITGTIEVVDSDGIHVEAEIPEEYSTSKRRAVRYANKVKKKGLWIAFDKGAPFFQREEFIPACDVKRVNLRYEPIAIPARPDRSLINSATH